MRTRVALLTLLGGAAAVAACSTTASLPFGTPSGTQTPTATPIPSAAASPTPLTVTGNVVLNSCFSATASGFSATLKSGSGVATSLGGHLLLLLQVTDDRSPRASGDQTEVTSASDLGNAGAWDVVAVTTVTTSGADAVANLSTQLARTYDTTATRAAEACVLPFFSTFTLASSAQLRASPWNGSSGGVIALVAETADIEGTVTADGDGFTGGAPSLVMAAGHTCDVATLDASDGHDAGMKGGGSDGRGFGAWGAGNSLQGGGGGNAGYEGGAGGGNGGHGGNGGPQGSTCTNATTVVAHAGVGMTLAPQQRLAFGGGGGGGDVANINAGVTGGAGGGLIIISAKVIKGGGTISANGHDAITPAATLVGEGGGGAGGTIWVRDTGTWSFSGSFSASGGNGANAQSGGSPGGGGGGGRIQLSGPPAGLPAVAGGVAGSGGVGGAGAGAVGTTF